MSSAVNLTMSNYFRISIRASDFTGIVEPVLPCGWLLSGDIECEIIEVQAAFEQNGVLIRSFYGRTEHAADRWCIAS